MATVDPTAHPDSPTTDPALRDLLPDAPEHRWGVHIGVDVGQVRDPSAFAVVEVVQRALGPGRHRPVTDGGATADPRRVRWMGDRYVELETETVYMTRALRRIELGTRYPEMAQQIADVVCAPLLAGRTRDVFIDQTGVGRPIAELITDAILAHQDRGNVAIRPITFTAGREYDPHTGKMAKAYLVSRLQALSQAKPERIILPANHPEAEAMRRELKDYSIKVSQDGYDQYGALKIGQWDDLATALGLACLEDPLGSEVGYIPFDVPGYPHA